jgi:hypothetical protein
MPELRASIDRAMSQFIHLADERTVAMIRKNGIMAGEIFGGGKGVHATPVLANHFLSHQWLRELKRRGIRTISAVQFRLDDEAEVDVGRYNGEHLRTTASGAVRIFMEHETGLGLEVRIPGAIPAKDITRIYTPRQISGWRYFPEAHGSKPCGCRYCQRGEIKNAKLRED